MSPPPTVAPVRRAPHARLWSALAVTLVFAGCRGNAAPPHAAGRAIRDDFGATVPAGPARRIVSLNPTTTEILFAIGAGSAVVGRAEWDRWPAAARRVPSVGPGLRPNVEAVLARRPDLVVMYASTDDRLAARQLREALVPVLALRVDRIADFRRAARLLGAVTGHRGAAATLVDTVDRTLARVRAATAALPHPSVFWPLWPQPLVTVGGGSYLDDLVAIAGGRNIYHDLAAPSPVVSLEDVVRRDPSIILASPDGAAGLRRDPRWQAVRAVRRGRVRLVDTTLVWRPSVHLGEAAVSLARLLHPRSFR